MTWQEFCTLLAGLGPDTPLGRIVTIRSEDNPEILKQFGKEQKKIRLEWRTRHARRANKEDVERFYFDVALAFRNMAGGDDA